MNVAFSGHGHFVLSPCANLEGDRGSRPSLKNRKNLGFVSNSGPNILENHEATEPEFNVGPSSARQRNAI